jgi:hypothetical protein
VELRILKFRHVHDVSILSEKVFSFLRMRQLLYFAFGILILWRAMSFRDPGALTFSLFIFLLGMVSAILSRGSCSFEARIVLSIMSIIDSLLTPKESSKTRTAPAKPRSKMPRKPMTKHSATNTSTSIFSNIFGKALKSKSLNITIASTGLALFALSTLTLFGYTTPLAVLGVYGLMVLVSTSAAVGGVGFFMLLAGVFGNPFRFRRGARK